MVLPLNEDITGAEAHVYEMRLRVKEDFGTLELRMVMGPSNNVKVSMLDPNLKRAWFREWGVKYVNLLTTFKIKENQYVSKQQWFAS